MKHTLIDQARAEVELLFNQLEQKADLNDLTPFNGAAEISSIMHKLKRAAEDANKQRISSGIKSFGRMDDIDHANAMAAVEQEEAEMQWQSYGQR